MGGGHGWGGEIGTGCKEGSRIKSIHTGVGVTAQHHTPPSTEVHSQVSSGSFTVFNIIPSAVIILNYVHV